MYLLMFYTIPLSFINYNIYLLVSLHNLKELNFLN